MNPLLTPLFAQVTLTAAVWFVLLIGRIYPLIRKGLNPQIVADAAKADALYKPIENLSDNFENLFEMPVLFYVGVLLALHLQLQDPTLVKLAWAFVIFRTLHSVNHCTVNIIRFRFMSYLISSVTILIFWIKIVSTLL